MKPLRIAQISDFHFTEMTYNPFRLFSKRLLGLANWLLFRKGAFSTASLDALPRALESLHLDHILLGGDFTSTALPSEFKKAKKFVSQLPAPWIAIPGNHDHYTYRAHRKKHFYKTLSNQNTGDYSLAEQGVEVHRIAPAWWVIALDTARATNLYSSRGLFSKKLEEHTKEILSKIPNDHSILLLSHYPFLSNDVARHSLSRASALEKLAKEDRRIKAFLHGHSHRHTIANLQPSDLPVILDSGCSADEKKGTFNVLNLDDKGIAIEVYRWKNGWKLDKLEKFAWTR